MNIVAIETTSPDLPEVGRHDPQKLMVLKNEIDISSPSSVMSYGVAPMTEIAKFSDSLMEGIKVKDAGEIGGQLGSLITKVKEYDPMGLEDKSFSFLKKLPIIGNLFKRGEITLNDNKDLIAQVDTIASHLDRSMVGLITDNERIELLYNQNFEYYLEVDAYVQAGKLKLEEVRNTELAEAKALADSSKDLLDAQRLKDLTENINRFERRIHDLELSKTISMQMAPQIRIVQNNNQQLAEKINNSIMSTLPIWKSQMVLSASLEEQSKAVKLQKDVSETTNRLLRQNAEILQINSIETAKEAERSIIDVETIREVQSRLVNTIEETMKIATDARVKRQAVEVELESMESNLRKRITDVVNSEEMRRERIEGDMKLKEVIKTARNKVEVDKHNK